MIFESFKQITKQLLIISPILFVGVSFFYIMYSYRKNGFLNWFRLVLIFIFTIYIVGLMFITNFPWPSTIHNKFLLKEHYQLIPFGFFKDIYLDFQKGHSLVSIIKSSALLQYILNILMLLPLGMYVSYYFDVTKTKIILISIAVSLFIEVGQVTRFWFVFDNQYRLFDVDDLVSNTLGGYLGYVLIEHFSHLLPNIKVTDKKAKERKNVGIIARVFIFLFDYSISLVIFSSIFFLINAAFDLSLKTITISRFWDYYPLYMFISYLLKSRTIAMWIFGVRKSFKNNLFTYKFIECLLFLSQIIISQYINNWYIITIIMIMFITPNKLMKDKSLIDLISFSQFEIIKRKK